MKLFKSLAVAGIALSAAACGDLEVVNLNDPDRARAISTPGDVESLISGGFSSWWKAGHWSTVGITMSVMADAHTSSWGNFAMREMGSEPRIAYNNDPSASYAYVTRNNWRDLYRALSGVRDGLIAIEGGVELGPGGADTHRAQTFAAFVQGLALGHLALTYDQAFIVDETTSLDDPNALPEMQPWPDVLAASLAKLDKAISMAGQPFTIPSPWVGDGGEMSNTRLAQISHAYKARFMASGPRDVAGRDAVNWNAVLAELDAAHTEDFNTYHDDINWAWDRLKVHAGANDGWARVDLQMLGPADQSGAFQEWKALTNVELRQPFLIDTDDARITTGADPTSDGLYVRYVAGLAFRPERGTYHFSNYSDNRWYPVRLANYVGTNGVFPVKELDFLRAEALYRAGDRQGAADLVNVHRVANGGLPPLTVDGATGDRCVPRTPTGACADLWESIKYEKRIEVWHYDYGVEFFDDRGWGDLVQYTPTQFPVPGAELDLLLMEIYTFGGPGGQSAAPQTFDIFTPANLHSKREALEAYDELRAAERKGAEIH